MLIKRAQGCLLGQLAGDALGSLVEFKSPETIACLYPDGVRELIDGGTWKTIAGQPTDDSEMALMLARTLVSNKIYDPLEVRDAYVFWLNSGPFDCGGTIASGLRGNSNPDSQANGALMRISPLGIWGVNYSLEQVAEWARQDAAITHIHPVCQQANAIFAMTLAYAIKNGSGVDDIYQNIVTWAEEMSALPELMRSIYAAENTPPKDYMHQQGWVLTAFQNALWQMLHACGLEEGIVDTVMRGGDTDTNAAICGALLGAIYGVDALPQQWVESILNCRPELGQPGVRQPRPSCFWPADALQLAEQLVALPS